MKKAIFKIAAVIIGLAFSLLAVEAGLRMLKIAHPKFYVVDGYTGTAHLPGFRGWYKGETTAWIEINSAGFRDIEHAKEKPAGTYRIAVLGDSYAEALQVEIKDTFWWIMGEALGGCPALEGKEVEVLNFGVGGYGTAQELMALRHKAWDYSPDMIVLAFLTGNDVMNNVPDFDPYALTPYFKYDGNGELYSDMSFRDTRSYKMKKRPAFLMLQKIINSSYLLQSVNNMRKKNKQRRSPAPAVSPDSGSGLVKPGHNVFEMIYFEPELEVWQRAWKVTEGIIEIMWKEISGKDTGFLLVTLTNPVQVKPRSEGRQPQALKYNEKDLFYPERRINALSRRLGFPSLNLAPYFQRYADENNVLLHGSDGIGHWNEKGHRLAGRRIAEEVCEILNQENRRSPGERSEL